jgi:Flp pilus assembly secretin CpaC
MRRLSLAFAAAFALMGAQAQAQNLGLGAGQAVNISLAAPVRDIVVADPTIADVSLVNERTLVVMGKHPGVTMIMAFDAAGRSLTSRQVVVTESAGGTLTVYRGNTPASTYVCDQQCDRLAARP